MITMSNSNNIQIAKLSHGDVRYLYTRQPQSRETLLFIHGMSYPFEVWSPLQQKANGSGWDTLSFDLYGRGFAMDTYLRKPGHKKP